MPESINDSFVQDQSRLLGEVNMLKRLKGRMSALMDKGTAEEGVGFNYQSLLHDRSTSADSAIWTSVQANNGSLSPPNTCEPAYLDCGSASTVYNYQMIQTATRSNQLCMLDVRAAYNFQEQVMATRNNFRDLIVDMWERQDKTAFFQLPGHKLVANAALTDYFGQTDFGGALPTSRMTAGIMHYIYNWQNRNAGGEEAVAMKDGAAQFIMIMSSEQQQGVIQNDPAVRQDIRFAQMGEGEAGWLLQSWNVDRPYAGFMTVIDDKMPRWNYNYGTAQYVEVPFYAQAATTVGTKIYPNPAYAAAAYEDVYVWMKETIRRDMPKPFGSGGSDAKFNPVNFNGEINWVNERSNNDNPLGLLGRWIARLAAQYRPGKPIYAWTIRVQNCSVAYLSPCY